MNIRSITCFVNIDRVETATRAIREAGELASAARQALETAGVPVQTTRLATQPLSHLPGEPLALAADLWPRCEKAGFEYLSLGSILADSPGADLALLDAIPDLIRATEVVFAGVLVARHGKGINLDAIQRTARVVRAIAHTTDLGFGNLRLAMLANVGPHAPFFPAAYHDGGPPALAIATESADLAVAAFSEANTLEEARARLIDQVEAAAAKMTSDL